MRRRRSRSDATASDTNPYVEQQVDDDSIVKEGHGDHPDDIIPPFACVEDGETKHYAGKNFGEAGEAIWKNGCDVPKPPKPEPPIAPPIQPLVKCVDNNGSTLTAIFGTARPANAARYARLDTVTQCGESFRRAGLSSAGCAGAMSWRRSGRRGSLKAPGHCRRA